MPVLSAEDTVCPSTVACGKTFLLTPGFISVRLDASADFQYGPQSEFFFSFSALALARLEKSGVAERPPRAELIA